MEVAKNNFGLIIVNATNSEGEFARYLLSALDEVLGSQGQRTAQPTKRLKKGNLGFLNIFIFYTLKNKNICTYVDVCRSSLVA